MKEDFQGGKNGFRIEILLDSSNCASENQKNSLILATILCIIVINTTEKHCNFVVAQKN